MVGVRTKVLLVVASLIAALVVPLSGTSGGSGVVSEPIVEGLAGPLGLAVAGDGSAYVAQTFAGKLTKVGPTGTVSDVAMATSPDSSITGVAVRGKQRVIYTESGFSPPEDYIGFLQWLRWNGTVKTLGDTATHEVTKNPDSTSTYGFVGISPECSAEVAAAVPDIPPEPYSGLIDSNTYATAFLGRKGMKAVVADAAGNSILLVRGLKVSTLAVLPPVVGPPITPEDAAGFGLPSCVVGLRFAFEPVPTDVEVGRDGLIYISSLGGGPEDPPLPTGGVFVLDPKTKALTRIGAGFTSATDLAVLPNGDIYVTELFLDRVSKLVNGAPQPVVELPQPAAIEYAHGKLWVTINAFENGAVVTVGL